MSDITARLRTAASIYSDSYPPSVLDGGGGGGDALTITSLVPNSAPSDIGWNGGYVVHGTGFDQFCKVTIDLVDAEETTWWDATQLTYGFDPATAGLTVGQHMVAVRSGDGSVTSAPLPFNITTPIPVVTGTGTDETADVCAHGTVDDVKAHVATHLDQAQAALDYEREGKNRSTLIGWLEDVLVDVYPAVEDED
jgi:hypothetical protein